MKPKEFVDKYYVYAKQAEQKTLIAAEALLAQSALETGWGRSCPNNMMFGIKAGRNWKGKKQLIRTKEYHNTDDKKYPVIHSINKIRDNRYLYDIEDYFRAYDSPADSFEDHGKLILNNKRYSMAAMVRTNAERFVEEIAVAGYATDPEYATKLKLIIKRIKQLI